MVLQYKTYSKYDGTKISPDVFFEYIINYNSSTQDSSVLSISHRSEVVYFLLQPLAFESWAYTSSTKLPEIIRWSQEFRIISSPNEITLYCPSIVEKTTC